MIRELELSPQAGVWASCRLICRLIRGGAMGRRSGNLGAVARRSGVRWCLKVACLLSLITALSRSAAIVMGAILVLWAGVGFLSTCAWLVER